jgi:hypothetical protein
MMAPPFRIAETRRTVERVQTSIPVEWGVTPAYARGGKIISLSAKGCLLRTEYVEPLYGKTIHLRFPSTNDDWITLEAQVIYYLRDVGFAVEFTALDKELSRALAQLVDENRDGLVLQNSEGGRSVPSKPTAAAPRYEGRRRFPRATVALNVQWGPTLTCEYSDRVTSLSLGGCFVMTERPAQEGTRVYVRLWEMHEGQGVFEGIVRYQLRLRPGHPPVGIGIEFTRLTPEDKVSLQDVLNFYSDTHSTWRPA